MTPRHGGAGAGPTASVALDGYVCPDLGGDAVEQLLVGIAEGPDAVAFELGGDGVERDAGGARRRDRRTPAGWPGAWC
jgi:hypothetical protein